MYIYVSGMIHMYMYTSYIGERQARRERGEDTSEICYVSHIQVNPL